jgi:CBS domain-containing protein
MAVVDDLVRAHEMYYADFTQPVIDVVRLMVEHNIGAVPVLRNGELAGIFSERDLMKRVVAALLDPRTTRVGDVMTTGPLVVAPNRSLEDCLALMKAHGFRHLPVCDGGKVKGLISLRDLLAYAVVEKDGEVQAMRAYIAQS